MSAGDLDEGLLDHLVVEFLDHGQRAVEFLRSAQALLAAPPATAAAPRVPDMVAYCLREAMKAIPDSQDSGIAGQWRTRSRAVVEAKLRYGQISDLPGEDGDAALRELLASIEDMQLTHQEDGIHQKRLIAVVVNRTGAQPLVAGTDPVSFYQDVLGRLDRAVHHGVSMNEIQQIWLECLAILRRLFLPPAVRYAELDELAAKESPESSDVSALVALLAGPNHLRYFLSKIQTPVWLTVLAKSELLEPPVGQGAWPMFAAVAGLKDAHGAEVATVLRGMLERWGSNPQRAWYVARAALDVGAHGRDVVLSTLRKHDRLGGIAYFAIKAAIDGDNADTFVEDVSDIVLNNQTWVQAQLHPEPLLAAFVDGMTSNNHASRIKLLSYKLAKVPPDDHDRRYFSIDNLGRLDDEVPPYRKHRPFWALLRTLTQALCKAAEWANAEELRCAMSPLPDDIKDRVCIWLLATTRSVKQSDLIMAIAAAIPSRYPTSDDLRVVDRVVNESGTEEYVSVWGEAVGEPPTVAKLSAALAAGSVPLPHRRVLGWSAVLPSPVLAEWSTALAIMSAAYGEPSRRSLEQSSPAVMGGYSQSPISEADLRSMSPESGARWIAAWRPGSSQWLVSALELARTLQAVVKSDIAEWARRPLATASLLRHPTYIHHYLQGLADGESLADAPVDELVDLIVLVRAHPWEAIALGSDPSDFDLDWRAAEHASIQLIRKMASSDVGFARRRDEVWAILRAETENVDEPSGVIGDSLDPLETAINRPCAKALEATLSFLGHEYRANGTIRSEATNLLSSILRVDGRTGAEYRAILASRISFLRHIAPEWFDASRDELFGDAAPAGLGQATVDLAIKWGRPSRWLLENYHSSIKDAVSRQVEHALEHYLAAMLWNSPGYSAQDAVEFLRSRGLLFAGGEAVGRLLRVPDAPAELIGVALEFWKCTLRVGTAGDLAGFGWYAEIGGIDTDIWIDLTLQTVVAARGRIDWAHKVAGRVAAVQPPTVSVLEILNYLVRGIGDDWDRREVAKIAAQTLQKAQILVEFSEYRRLHTTLAERGAL